MAGTGDDLLLFIRGPSLNFQVQVPRPGADSESARDLRRASVPGPGRLRRVRVTVLYQPRGPGSTVTVTAGCLRK